MTDIIDKWTVRGYTVRLHTDPDCESPRGNCNPDVIYTRPLRWANPPDDGNRLPETIDCPTCGGEGRQMDADTDCPTCNGSGDLDPTWPRLVQWAIREHGATKVLALDGPHDYGARWTINENPTDDHEPRAIMFDAKTERDICGTPLDLVEIAMRADLDEYNRWADNDCYGYTITDVNGDEVDSCWGFIGSEYAREQANEMVPDEPAVKLYSVRLSAAQWTAVLDNLPADLDCRDDIAAVFNLEVMP